MPLRMLLDSGAVQAEDVALVGARNLDPPEEEFIAASGVGTGSEAVVSALDGTVGAYVAVDFDAFGEDEVAPFMPEPGGLSLEEAEKLLGGVRGRRPTCSARASRGSSPTSGTWSPLAAWPPRSASDGGLLDSARGRGDRHLDRAPEPSGAVPEREASSEHLSRVWLALPGRRARSEPLGLPHCNHHFRVRAKDRIAQLADEGTFKEEAADSASEDPLSFFDMRPYTERLVEAEQETGQGDAMMIGSAAIERVRCELAVMDFAFMGGSMGSVVGEKFVRACESAAEQGVPLVSVTSSGGARMQDPVSDAAPEDRLRG